MEEAFEVSNLIATAGLATTAAFRGAVGSTSFFWISSLQAVMVTMPRTRMMARMVRSRDTSASRVIHARRNHLGRSSGLRETRDFANRPRDRGALFPSY